MKRLIYYTTVTIILPAVGVLVTLANNSVDKNYKKDICTRYCHDRVCDHTPALPESIASDEGFYGNVINSLFDIGGIFSSVLDITLFQGYTIANLLVFCVVVPVVHFAIGFLTLTGE